MRPVLAFVAEGPHFGAAFFDGGAHYRKVSRALPIYRPDSSAIIELPNPPLPDFIHIDGGQLPELWGHATWVLCSGFDHVKTHDVIAGRQDPSARPSAIGLLQPVLQIKLVAHFKLREIQDHVHPLGHTQVNAGGADWLRQKISVPGDDDEWMKGLAFFAGAEKDLEEPGWAAIQNAEAIFPAFYFKKRLNPPVDGIFVAQHPVGIKLVEDYLAILIKENVVQQHGDVIFATGQPKRPRSRVVFII